MKAITAVDKWTSSIIITLVIATSVGLFFTAPSTTPLEAAMAATVKLSDPDGPGHGSGVVISAKGLILTNAHVCDVNAELNVSTQDGRHAVAEVLWKGSDKRDVCLMKITGRPETDIVSVFEPLVWTPITLATEVPAAGSPLYALGSPGPYEFTVTKGIVVQQTVKVDSRLHTPPTDRFTMDAAVIGGSSGGPVINEQGELIGLTVEVMQVRGVPISFAHAIHIDLIREMLAL